MVPAAKASFLAAGRAEKWLTSVRALEHGLAVFEKCRAGQVPGTFGFAVLTGESVAIAESIVREQIAREPKGVARAVESAVALFSRATRVSIEISPEDESLVAASMPALRAALPVGAEVELVAREGMARGGCMIRSSEGTVDARIETQFRRMRAGIIGDAETEARPAVDAKSGATAEGADSTGGGAA